MRSLKTWRWIVTTTAALIIGGITWLVVGQLVRREIAFGGLVFTFLVIVGATLADWFARDRKGGTTTWKERLTSPNWVARAGMSAFFGLGAGLFVQQFITPTDNDIFRGLLNDIKAGQAETSAKLDTANETLRRVEEQTAAKPWRAFDNIAGYWGEERRNCQAVYRFERQGQGLTISVVKGAEILGNYRMTASITPGGQDDDPLRATLRSSTEADEVHGQALVFTYHDDGGGYRRLDWLNETRSDAGVLKLEPCEMP